MNSHAAAIELQGRKVLIVDDTPANIAVLAGILQHEGYEIYVAPSGDVALRVAHDSRPDLILLDVMMPGMDGFETCRALKGSEATDDIPVIFVTARSDPQDIIAGFDVGAVDYINKPVRQEEVCARVRAHLQIRACQDRLREQAERQRAILNNISEGLLIVDHKGVIVSANPAVERLLGYSNGALLERSIADLLLPPLDRTYLDFLAAEPGSAAASALPHGPREVQVRHRDGHVMPVDFTLSPMFSARDWAIVLIRDIAERKLAEDELHRVASQDALTGIANRRSFDSRLLQEWQRAQRSAAPLSLLMIDVDFFKQYNDSLGHPAGDHCLQQVAQALQRQNQRALDLVARYGGEEFVVLLTGTDALGAQRCGELLRAAVAALALPHPGSKVAAQVTVSIGVASTVPSRELGAEALLAAADRSLYQAKAHGRNRVAAPEQPT